ncbi:hypothetical protein Noda2021_00440 [Candidatus Dependentiae bacterium Noda2021]|nr:hypothetical protein Noda2021_00440 [Candidatus Dependentiae bacterium Noda2021]
MSDDVKHKRKILKKINAAKNKENSKNVPNIGIPSPVDYKKIIIFSPGTTPEIQPVPCGDGKKTNTKALVDQSNTTNQHNSINNLQAQPNQSVTNQKAIATEESAPHLQFR